MNMDTIDRDLNNLHAWTSKQPEYKTKNVHSLGELKLIY